MEKRRRESDAILAFVKNRENKMLQAFAGLFLFLFCETVLALLLPQILRLLIDQLDQKERNWLLGCALGYCAPSW